MVKIRDTLDSSGIIALSQAEYKDGAKELLKMVAAEMEFRKRKVRNGRLSRVFRNDVRYDVGALDVLESLLALPSEARKMIEEVES